MKIRKNQLVRYKWDFSIGYTISDPDKIGHIWVQLIPSMLANTPKVYHIDNLKAIGFKEANDCLLKAWRSKANDGAINGDTYYPARDQLFQLYMNGVLGEFFDLFDVFWKIDDCYQFEGILE